MKKAHIIGVCGIAMSATARLLQEQGWTVSGSDNSFYPPASTYVDKLGITLSEGYSPNNIPADTELIVIGRNAELNPETNAEVQAALASGVTIRSYPEVLKEIAEEKDRIVVAGSYGKSTVTSLLSYILIHAGKEPGYFIGAQPEDIEYTSAIGTGKTFILEGDEYPTAHGDDRSKFLHYNPSTVLLTSVDHDHVNVFPTYEDYQKPFIELLEKMPSDGLLVACTDNEGVSAIGHHTEARITTYGIHNDAIWTAHNISYGETTTFDLRKDGAHIATLTTRLLGAHNVQNIVGAAALLLERGLVTVSELTEAMEAFTGIKRRLNRITDATSLPTYEGFGSSYEKARAAIEAMELHFPKKKLVILFEPHTFSWRNRDTIEWYDSVFREAVHVVVYHPPSQGAETHKQLSQDEIVERITTSGTPTTAVTTGESTRAALKEYLKADTVLLILSSGNFGGILDTLPEWLNKNT
jgi:UDP-N-acetylmuramate: L-alanyl-gamma-D-glutamyl-meso-diaminopimelate ligase